MGGLVPLGYEGIERRLVINPAEADTVREIFNTYARLGCLTKLKRYLEENQTRSKMRRNNAGQASGGAIYSRGALHHLLRNRIYLGEIVHRDQHFPGQHQPIVPYKLWSKVAKRLTANDQARRKTSSMSAPSLLRGKLFDQRGVRFTPTHSLKAGKRYRYYTSQSVIQGSGAKPKVARIPAQQLDDLVNLLIRRVLGSPGELTQDIKDEETRDLVTAQSENLAKAWPELNITRREEMLTNILIRVTVDDTKVRVHLDKAKLLESILGRTSKVVLTHPACQERFELTSSFAITRKGCEIFLVPRNGDSRPVTIVPAILKAVARSRAWYEKIVAGEFRTIEQLARKSGLTKRYVRKILLCARMSPEVIEALLTGNHRLDLTLTEVLRDMPLEWDEQRRRFLG